MDLRAFAAFVVLATAVPVSADIVTLIDAVETTAGNLRVPVSNNGRLSFRPCDMACDEDFVMARLTPGTTFVVHGAGVDFLEFRKEFYNLRQGHDVYALVSYHVDKNTITSVQIGY